MEDLKEYKNKLIDSVLDDIKRKYPLVRITYPKGLLTQDFVENRLNINCDIHGYIKSFNFG